MAMTKFQISAAIAEKTEITKAQAETVLDTLVDLACKGAAEGFITQTDQSGSRSPYRPESRNRRNNSN